MWVKSMCSFSGALTEGGSIPHACQWVSSERLLTTVDQLQAATAAWETAAAKLAELEKA